MAVVSIPTEIAEAMSSGDLVAFCGCGISMATGALPSGSALAQDLCARASLPLSGDLPAVARSYESRNGRHSLIDYISKKIEPHRSPMPTHEEVARIPFKVVVTTNWDELLERAFEKLGRNYALVVKDSDVAFVSSATTPIVKLHGTISQKDTLVVSDRDYYDFLGRQPGLAGLLRSWMLTSTVLYLGYNLGDPDFKAVFYECQRVLGPLKRRAYAIQLNPSKTVVDDWQQENVQVLAADAFDFLSAL